MTDSETPQWNDNLDRDLNTLSKSSAALDQKIDSRTIAIDIALEKIQAEMPVVQTFNDKVLLDVGGEIFRTTIELLTFEDSLFSTMFSGRIPLDQDPDDGSYFIDRSPEYFNYILEYMNYGTLSVNIKKMDKLLKAGILKEAQFYELNGLIELLGGKVVKLVNSNLSSTIFEFESEWDGNGLFSYLKEIEEPPVFKIVDGTSTDSTYMIKGGSSLFNVTQKDALEILGADVEWTMCSPCPGEKYFIVDIGEDKEFEVSETTFTCKYSTSYWSGGVILYGSNDESEWTRISNVSLGVTRIETEDPQAYRYFKIDNTTGSQTLCSGWEMYGTLL